MSHISDLYGNAKRNLLLSIYQVLDEADRLLNEDFEKSLDDILKVIPRERRTYLFSATMTKKVYFNYFNLSTDVAVLLILFPFCTMECWTLSTFK
jgi:hypothetical protein